MNFYVPGTLFFGQMYCKILYFNILCHYKHILSEKCWVLVCLWELLTIILIFLITETFFLWLAIKLPSVWHTLYRRRHDNKKLFSMYCYLNTYLLAFMQKFCFTWFNITKWKKTHWNVSNIFFSSMLSYILILMSLYSMFKHKFYI